MSIEIVPVGSVAIWITTKPGCEEGLAVVVVGCTVVVVGTVEAVVDGEGSVVDVGEPAEVVGAGSDVAGVEVVGTPGSVVVGAADDVVLAVGSAPAVAAAVAATAGATMRQAHTSTAIRVRRGRLSAAPGHVRPAHVASPVPHSEGAAAVVVSASRCRTRA